jgi:hypothetical protein
MQDATEVVAQAASWAANQKHAQPNLLVVGVIGSYGRGTAGVGSDLDLLLVLRHCNEPIWQRLRRWDTKDLPLTSDLLVYSLSEWQTLPQWNPRLAEALRQDTLGWGIRRPEIFCDWCVHGAMT